MPRKQVREVAYAGFWIRAVAALIDGLILLPAAFAVRAAFWAAFPDFSFWGLRSRTDSLSLFVISAAVIAAIDLAYFILMTGRYQATLGKMALKLRVTDSAFGPVSYRQAAAREFTKWFFRLAIYLGELGSILAAIPFVWCAFDRHKQTWYDKLADTYVVRSRL
jgi:uncharacterized RDD family membrane protein YckC